jgi:MFS family permease
MFTDSRQRSAGITASAIIAILGSLGAFLFAALMGLNAIVMSGSPVAASLPNQPPLPPIVLFTAMAVLYCGLGAWGIASAVGLLMLKNWARRSFVIFGGLLVFLSVCLTAGSMVAAFVVAPATAPIPADVPRGLIAGVFLAVAVLGLVCLGIAIWWLVYFNRPAIKAAFMGEAAAQVPHPFPLTVTIIGWLLITGSALTAVNMFSPYPLLIFGMVLRGLPAGLALALIAAVGLTAGIGMLKKHVDAYSLAVGYFGFGVLNVLSYLVVPGALTRMQEVYRETQGNQTLPAAAANSIMAFAIFVGLVGTSLLLLLLIRARRPFIDACRSDSE